MSHKALLSSVAAVSLVVVGCSATTSPPPPDDGGAADGAPVDTGGTPSHDSGVSADAPSPPGDSGDTGSAHDGGQPDGPSGTQLVQSSSAQLLGVTSDDYAVYTDPTTNEISAVALAGGSSPLSLGASSLLPVIAGPVVAWWNILDPSTGVGELSIWTKAYGVQALSMTSMSGPFAVSADGANVLYLDGVDGASHTGGVSVATTSGTKTALLTAVDLMRPTSLAFGGAYAVVAWSTLASPAAMLASFTGNEWTETMLAPDIPAVRPGFVLDPAGTQALVTGVASLDVYPLAGGAPKTIDGVPGVGAFTNNGTSVIYTTPSNVLKTSPIAMPAPTILASNLSYLIAVSPDTSWVLASLMEDPMGGNLSDLFIASTTKAGTPATISATPDTFVFGNPFTADSSHALFFTPWDPSAVPPVSTLNAVPSGGGAGTVLGQQVGSYYPSTAAKVVFNANFNPNAGMQGTADILSVDTATSAPSTLLVPHADAAFALSSDHSKVVYTWTALPTATAGMWVLPIP